MIIVFDSCFQGLGMPYVVYFFSPVSWVNLNMLDMTKTTPLPSVPYAYIGLIALCVLLFGLLLPRGTHALRRGGVRHEPYAEG